ncbi:MAG: flagellar motor switch protein FliN [Vulcanimicrobiota bacterium]|nr:flagellar motor switch protein FliN [Candidatus Eremiobacteraeota bacterium]
MEDYNAQPQRPKKREDLTILYDVPFIVEAEMGRTTKSVRDVLKFGEGAVIELDKDGNDPVDLVVNGTLIARGEVVEIEGNYGVRITELMN